MLQILYGSLAYCIHIQTQRAHPIQLFTYKLSMINCLSDTDELLASVVRAKVRNSRWIIIDTKEAVITGFSNELDRARQREIGEWVSLEEVTGIEEWFPPQVERWSRRAELWIRRMWAQTVALPAFEFGLRFCYVLFVLKLLKINFN